MIMITQNEVIAENEADLRNAVNSDNGIDYVYLANNITLTEGITIYAGKASLTIDGEYPVGSGDLHQVTDVDSPFSDWTIGIRSTSNITITLRNMTINGRNIYGIPYITDALTANTSGVSVIYENVTYIGPQITFNPSGFTRYTDCNITIRQNGTQQPQEVGEVNRVEIGGVTSITHASTTDAVFYFRGTASTMFLTVLEDAQVDINSVNYFMYNMNLLGTPLPVPYAIRSRASFNLEVNKGIAFDNRNQAASFLVEEDASFYYIQTANNGTQASLYVNGEFTVMERASFYMQAVNGTQPLIRFTSSTSRLNASNPMSFVLYSPVSPAFYSVGTTQFVFSVGQLNTWNPATVPVSSAGDFEDTPDFKWFKKDYANLLEVNGSFTQSATSASSNLITEDEPYPVITGLHLHDARVFSMGDWPVIVNQVVDDGRPITGLTEAGANMRAVYTPEGGTEHIVPGTAGADGVFVISTQGETPPNVPAGTEVAVWSNIPFLIKYTTIIAVEVGEIVITRAPVHIAFNTPPLLVGNDVFLRRYYPEDDEPVLVYDSRVDSTSWELLATITGDLQTEDGAYTLPGALVLRQDDGQLVQLSDQPIVVYTGGPKGEEPETTEVTWDVDKGILLHITQPIRFGITYTTNVNWELRSI